MLGNVGDEMNLADSHGGYAGKSIIEKLRDKADGYYNQWMGEPDEDAATIIQGRIEGVCDALALMTNTTMDLQFNSAEARYDDNRRMEKLTNGG